VTWFGITENIVADIIFVFAITPLFATLVLIMTRWRPHAQLIRFLGCTSQSLTIAVFFSNLKIQRGGAWDFRDLPRTYSGSAVPESEFALMQTITEALEAPVSDWLSRLISGLAKRVPGRKVRNWLGPRRVEVLYELSPLASPPRVPKAVTICLGSAGYNSVTDLYMSTMQPLMWFSLDIPKQLYQSGGTPIDHDGDLALLHRFRVEEGHVVYIAAGVGINGTRGALRFLFSNWRELDRKYSHREFAIALAFPSVYDDPFGFRRPTQLAELSR
jgi:hypothetical protein